jgi:hypothetical protein
MKALVKFFNLKKSSVIKQDLYAKKDENGKKD